MISAVVLIDNIFCYTFAYVSDKVWNQLQVRRDNQIGVQEMLAVVLLLETVEEKLRDRMLLLWKSNVADGLSRNDVSDMVRLKATFVKARLPVWLDTLWDAPTS